MFATLLLHRVMERTSATLMAFAPVGHAKLGRKGVRAGRFSWNAKPFLIPPNDELSKFWKFRNMLAALALENGNEAEDAALTMACET